MKISDSHTDFLTAITSRCDREIFIYKALNDNIKNISCAVFTTENKLTLHDVENYNEELKYLSNKYKVNLILSIEDLGFINNINQLDNLVDLKPFSVTLTWNCANQFAGGSYNCNGLTPLGKEVVKKMENHNILIDTAHLSRKGFWQVANMTKFPLYNSHCNIYSLKRHKRNLTDKQIQAIVDTNGYMGITLYQKFISTYKISSKDIAFQFDYLIKNFGYKNFGLGTDFYGVDFEFLPTDVKEYCDVKNIIRELSRLGYNKKIIECVMCENFENFMQRIANFRNQT